MQLSRFLLQTKPLSIRCYLGNKSPYNYSNSMSKHKNNLIFFLASWAFQVQQLKLRKEEKKNNAKQTNRIKMCTQDQG